MQLNRRGAMAAGLACLSSVCRAATARSFPLGLVIHSFPIQVARDRDRPAWQRLGDPERFLAHGARLGATSIQVGLGRLDDTRAGELRDQARAAGIALEGIVSLPRDESDLPRFQAELESARKAGANIVRTVMLSGRRYETFRSADAFRKFGEQARNSLALAAPVVARLGLELAVENHKDWRAEELLDILRRHGNDHVGVCLDTGNSIALLEDPMEVIETLAPRTFTTHFKDMAVEEYADGFRLSEVPLGTGILDLPKVVRAIRAAAPQARFNLEMITRDPLDIPCLTDGYWATFAALPGRELARALRFARGKARPPLPRVSNLPVDRQLSVEAENIQRCMDYARDHLPG